MDQLTKAVLDRPSGFSYPISVSDGVLKGRDVHLAAVAFRERGKPTMLKKQKKSRCT